jgi:enoyl-CoA hydratase/carnithine racemase
MSETAAFQFPARVEGGLARIDLGRPEAGNGLTRDMMQAMAGLVRELASRPETRAIVIDARGDHFCLGRDGRGEQQGGLTPYEVRTQMLAVVLDVYDAISAVPVPVVACVQGDAIGFGAALATACDVTLTSDAARFSFPEIDHGIAPTLAMSSALRKVPAKMLSYLIYTGEPIDALQAMNFGIVSQVFPAGEFQERCEAFLTKLASRPRIILETIKKYQTNAGELSPAMASEYAGVLMAVNRTAKA